jgi:hypothetical protein
MHPWSTTGAWSATVVMWQACVLAYGVRLEVALFCRYTVDVHGPVAALGGNIFVERVPRDTLDVMIVFSNFMHA